MALFSNDKDNQFADDCFKAALADKQIILFPILSVVIFSVVCWLFVKPVCMKLSLFDDAGFMDHFYRLVHYFSAQGTSKIKLGGYWLACYMSLCGIVMFFNFCILASAKFAQQENSFMASLALVFSRLPQIFLWWLLGATFGVVINIVSWFAPRDWEKIELNFGNLSTNPSSFLGIFSYARPIVVFEGKFPFAALIKSFPLTEKLSNRELTSGARMGMRILLPLLSLIGLIFLVWKFHLPFAPYLISASVIGITALCVFSSFIETFYIGALYLQNSPKAFSES